jgi:hypothetical protein
MMLHHSFESSSPGRWGIRSARGSPSPVTAHRRAGHGLALPFAATASAGGTCDATPRSGLTTCRRVVVFGRPWCSSACGARKNRESGENPERPRRCDWERKPQSTSLAAVAAEKTRRVGAPRGACPEVRRPASGRFVGLPSWERLRHAGPFGVSPLTQVRRSSRAAEPHRREYRFAARLGERAAGPVPRLDLGRSSSSNGSRAGA